MDKQPADAQEAEGKRGLDTMSPSNVIHMETEQVRAVSSSLAQFAEKLSTYHARILEAANGIDWSGPNHDEFIEEINKWRNAIYPNIESSNFYSHRVIDEVDEWELGAESLARINLVSLSVPGYVHPENAYSTDPARIEDIKSYLKLTPEGREILKYMEENNIVIEFGDLSNPHVTGHTDPKGERITLDMDYADLTDAELAAVLVHEGTHAMQLYHPEDNNPVWGGFFNDLHFWTDGIPNIIFPWQNEYDAYRAEADFWNSISGGQPPSPELDFTMKMIFTPEGEYRTFYDSMEYLHSNADYTHSLDPTPQAANAVSVTKFLLHKFLGL